MYRVYWEHPSQGKNKYGEVGYNGAGKQYRRLRYAVLFAQKLRQDPQTGHIDITYEGGDQEEWTSGENPKDKFVFENGEFRLLEELPKWLLWEEAA